MGRRGRKPKSETAQKSVETFTADKDELLKVFDKKKIEHENHVSGEFDITPVGSPSLLGGNGLDLFTGADYDDAIKKAYDWMERKNREHKDCKIELLHYFLQRAFGKSVLVSYNIVPITQ